MSWPPPRRYVTPLSRRWWISRAATRVPVLQAQLDAIKSTYHLLLDERTRLGMIIQNIAALRSQLAAQPAGEVINTGDDLTALLLQLQAFNAQSNTVQLQISGLQTPTTRTNAQGITFLDELVKNIQSRTEEIDAQLAPLESQTLDLQQRISQIDVQEQRLEQDNELAQTVYSTLANKFAEARIGRAYPPLVCKLPAMRSSPKTRPARTRKTTSSSAACWVWASALLRFYSSATGAAWLNPPARSTDRS